MEENKSNIFKTSIGGQALIEGVMMRGPFKTAMAVRKPDGEIFLQVDSNQDIGEKFPLLNLPFIRGGVKLIESMILGIRAITFSASFWEKEEINESTKKDTWVSNQKEKIETFFMIFLSLFIAVALFVVIPSYLANLLRQLTESTILLNLVEGLIRIIFFFIYLFYISKLEDIRRVFEYHGSEHKTIHCYEHGEPLTIENVMKYPKEHPRCGTSFLFMVLAISVITLSFFGWPDPILRIMIRLMMFPVIAGISYEANRIIGKSDNKFCNILRKPGLKIQEFATVREPDEEQVEVAIESLKAVIPEDGVSDSWN